MSDITREDAIKILKDTLYDERTPNNYIQAVRMGREALENQKTGHWIGKPIAGRGTVRCSNCYHHFYENAGLWVYCPDCGAKMEGE